MVGAGSTGLSVVRFLATRGAHITLTDARPPEVLAEALEEARRLDAAVEAGGHRSETFEAADLIVLSPGVPPWIEPLSRARKRHIPIVSELELSARCIAEPIIAVTGTNGKTTTATLIAEMFRAGGVPCFLGGNIGTPLIDYVTLGKTARVIVAEVSSFQLEATSSLRARAAILLNLAADHMDRYPGFADYCAAKGRIFRNQGAGDASIYNADDLNARDQARAAAGTPLPFSRQGRCGPEPGEPSCGISDDRIVLSLGGSEEEYPLREIRLRGAHNMDNAMASIAAARWLGCPADGVRAALGEFAGLPHRNEPVGEARGIRFINDSKGTNAEAVRSAIAGVEGTVVLILGGQDKKGDFGPLREIFPGKVKAAVLYGEARETLRAALGEGVRIESIRSFREAFRAACSLAASGDTVLLSPGCASFDQFASYAERGELFRSLVAELAGSHSPGRGPGEDSP